MPKSTSPAPPPPIKPAHPQEVVAALTQWQHSAAQMRRLVAAHTEAHWRFGLMWGEVMLGQSQAARATLRAQVQAQAATLTEVSTSALKALTPHAGWTTPGWSGGLAPALQAVLRDGQEARADLIAAQQETLAAFARRAEGAPRT